MAMPSPEMLHEKTQIFLIMLHEKTFLGIDVEIMLIKTLKHDIHMGGAVFVVAVVN